MNMNDLSVNNAQQKDLKETNNDLSRNTHSTDTEPDADLLHIHQDSNLIQQEEETKITEDNNQKCKNKRVKNGFTRVIEKLPSYEYNIQKKRKNLRNNYEDNEYSDDIALNIRDTDNNRFISYFEAFLYIANQCKKCNVKYTREICRKYLKDCYIIDFAHDDFIRIVPHISKKDFNKYFLLTQREMKYI